MAPVNAMPEDPDVVAAAVSGDETAFAALTRRYRRELHVHGYRMLGSFEDAEDIVQETFLRAWQKRAGFERRGSFKAWLYRIAINTAKNALVSSRRRPVDYDLDLQDPEQYDMQARLKDSETPERLLLTDEIRDTVNAAIADLPEDLRTAIMLREIEGLSYEEIAAAMECPVGTVRSRIFRAREAIDIRLRPIYEGGLGRLEE